MFALRDTAAEASVRERGGGWLPAIASSSPALDSHRPPAATDKRTHIAAGAIAAVPHAPDKQINKQETFPFS